MKRPAFVCALAIASVLAVAGCKKAAPLPPAPVAFNAPIELSKLKEVLMTNMNDEVQASLGKVAAGLRYGYDYETVLEELGNISTNSSLSQPQRKVVNKVTEQVKQFVSTAKPPQ